MLVGEWGAYYGNPAAAAARFTLGQFQEIDCGDLYWAFRRDLAKSPLIQSLERPALAIGAVSGLEPDRLAAHCALAPSTRYTIYPSAHFTAVQRFGSVPHRRADLSADYL